MGSSVCPGISVSVGRGTGELPASAVCVPCRATRVAAFSVARASGVGVALNSLHAREIMANAATASIAFLLSGNVVLQKRNKFLRVCIICFKSINGIEDLGL